MALILCPECNAAVSTAAPACPHCGFVPTSVATTTPALAAPTQEPPKKKRKWPWVVGALFVFWAIGSTDTGTSSPGSHASPGSRRSAAPATTWRDRDNSTMAYIRTEDWVKERLRAPSTADFPGVFDGRSDHTTYLGNQRYRIRSYVDSQNGFGAMIRTWFTAEVMQTDEDRWSLVSLTFDP